MNNPNPTMKAAKQSKTATPKKAAKRRATAIHDTREAWLTAAVALFRPEFARIQKTIRAAFPDRYAKVKTTLPRNIKVTCGWPSHRGTAARGRVIGQCWNPKVSKGGTTEIFISPYLESTTRVLDVLCHELIHAAIGTAEGHGHLFATCAKHLMLEGKPTATVGSEDFVTFSQNHLMPALGRYPHKQMDVTEYEISDKPKKQGTRMIKVACGCCGYTVRTTQKWIDVGVPACPNPECDDHGEEMEAHAPRTRGTGRPKDNNG